MTLPLRYYIVSGIVHHLISSEEDKGVGTQHLNSVITYVRSIF